MKVQAKLDNAKLQVMFAEMAVERVCSACTALSLEQLSDLC